MHYVGVDLHRRSAVVTVIDEQGELYTDPLREWTPLRDRV